jgi:phosphoesterase RecJ-like protein
VFFHESDGIIKISFRSNGTIPANDLARTHFGGGGHLNAAGGKFVGKIEESNCKICNDFT